MQLQQLEYFVKIVEYGSLNKASEYFYVTQPALSKAIMNLEEEIGAEVLRRTNKGVQMTENGKKLYEYAKDILSQVALIQSIATEDTRKILHVSSYPILSISRIVADFYNRHQEDQLYFHLTEGRLAHVIEDVETGRSEIGFLLINHSQLREVKNTLRHKELTLTVLGHDTWYANIGPRNPLYDREEVTMQELIQFPIVRYSADHYSNLTNYMRIDGIPLAQTRQQIYVNDNAGLVNVIRETHAFRYGPGLSSRDYESFGIRSIPIHNCDVDVAAGWIKKKNALLSDTAAEFVSLLETWVAEEALK